MKNLIYIFVFFISYLANSQSLSVFNLDASGFPKIKANFYAFDAIGNQLTNLSTIDFEVTENGLQRNVTTLTCPSPKPPIALSSVLVVDVSGSMGYNMGGFINLDLAKEAASAWVNGLPLGKSECAITSFNTQNYFNRDFTTDRNSLLTAISRFGANGGTNYEAALINPVAGGILAVQRGKYKKVIVFLTDGQPNFPPNESLIISEAKKNNITIYCVSLNMPLPDCMKHFAELTGGQWFGNVTTVTEAKSIYQKILQVAQGIDPCTIEWNSELTCIEGTKQVKVLLKQYSVFEETSYLSPQSSIAKIEVNPISIYYKNKIPDGTKYDTTITVTAKNTDVNVTNITSSNPLFTVAPTNFTLASGQNRTITVSFTPTDSSYQYSKFTIENDVCESNLYTTGGFKGIKAKVPTLKLTHPNGGEVFVVGTDTVMTWEGVLPTDVVNLEYSIDNGKNWIFLTDKATNLKWIWKNVPKPPSNQCLARVTANAKTISECQNGEIQIYNQIWMCSNLDVTTYRDGTPIPEVTNPTEWKKLTTGAWCYYNNDPAMGAIYGKLYNWYAVMDARGLAPDGWHVPSDEEWTTLSDCLGGHSISGGKLKSTGTIETGDGLWYTPNIGATNESQFSALPGGFRYPNGSFDGIGNYSYWWSSTKDDAIYIWDRCLLNYDGGLYSYVNEKGYGLSIRCVKYSSEINNINRTLNGHTDGVIGVSWSPDGSKIASGGIDNKLKLWDATSGNLIRTLTGHSERITCIAFSPDGKEVATGSYDRTIKIWDVSSGNLIKTLSGHNDWVLGIAYSPDGTKIASASADNTVKLWNVATGNMINTFTGNPGYVESVAFSPDGTQIVSGGGQHSSDFSLKLWDITTKNLVRTFSGHTNNVHHVAFSPDGTQIASASWDNTIKLWNTNNGNLINTLFGHNNLVFGVAFSPDGSQLASAGADSNVKIWEVKNGNLNHTFAGHTSGVLDVSWNPDGKQVVSCSYDKTVKIWDLNVSSSLSDVSDAVWSIVMPTIVSKDIDMKKCLVGSMKDSVATPFISNTGTYKCRIDSIYFTGADAGAFSLIAGIPEYYINNGENKFAEFSFQPTRVGLHSAKIKIITQADTLTQNIIGEGIKQTIEVVGDFIDFGKVGVGFSKDTIQALTIKNIGTTPIQITKTNHNKPNDYDFTKGNSAGFILAPNEIKKLDLRFSPSELGRTSGLLEFHYAGVGSPAVVQLFGEGIGGKVIIDNDSAYPGEKRFLRLRLGNEIKPSAQTGVTQFRVKLSYNPTILTMLDSKAVKTFDLIKETVEITKPWDNVAELLGEFEVEVGLGNADFTDLVIEEFNWLDAQVNVIDFGTEKQNGTFKLLGICYEGGARLVNPNGIAGIMQIRPNPASEDIEIGINLIEKGYSIVSIYNSNGEKMKEYNMTGKKGLQTINLDISEFSNGLYFVQLLTPTIVKNQKLMIIK